MTVQDIEALFAGRKAAMADRDSKRLAADYAEECVLESPTYGRLFGRAAVEQVYRQFFAAFPDITISYSDLVVTGDRVVQASTLEGTDTGGFLGQPATGRPFRFFFVQLFTIENHKIVHERRVFDLTGLMLQLATHPGKSAETAHIYRETLERVRLEQELKIAAEIQQALLPARRHESAYCEIAAASMPCRAIGGDFFDYFDSPDGTVRFALGDVSGKGPPAALLAAEIQGVLAAHSHSTSTSAQTIARLNEVLLRRAIESRFVTIVHGVLTPAGRLVYTNGGHNPPILLGRRGIQRFEKGGLIVGAFTDAIFEEDTIQLDPGDALVLYTDGITEALNTDGVEFGETRLMSCLASNCEAAPAALLDTLFSTVREFSIGAPQNDDLTAMILRFTARDA
jgi:predicted ester cyclase